MSPPFLYTFGGNAIVGGCAVSAVEAKAQWRAAPAGAEGEEPALTRYQAPENRMLRPLPRLDGGHSPPVGNSDAAAHGWHLSVVEAWRSAMEYEIFFS